MWALSYRPEIENDVVDAISWYDSKRPGLGDAFKLEYLAAIRRIRDNLDRDRTKMVVQDRVRNLRRCFNLLVDLRIVFSLESGRNFR